MTKMEKTAVRIWQGFWQIADPKIWVASTVPLVVATALAWAKTGTIDVGWMLLAFLAIYLIEIGKNAVNECIDWISGIDGSIPPEKRNDFSGGKKTIVDGKLSVAENAVIAFITLALAMVIGIMVGIYHEPHVLWIGFLGGALAVFYSLPPFKFNYTGLGEFAVGMAFGPLMTLGMYVHLTGDLDPVAALVGLPIGFFIANLIWINQYPDYEADKLGGKRNWLVRIGKQKGIKVYAALYVCAFVSLAVLAVADWNPFWLLGLVTVPIAKRNVRTAANNLDNFRGFLAANAGTVQSYMLLGVAMIVAAACGAFIG
jgi:1,4-dihydroxy-2-naphthoate octaprenyltransferase